MEGSVKVQEEGSMNTPLDRGAPSLETNTLNETEEEIGGVDKFDANLIVKEVKGVSAALVTLASTVNEAMGFYKDLNSRVNEVQKEQTEMNNKFDRVEKYLIGGERTEGASTKTKKAGHKKAALKILQDDIINVDIDVSDDEKPPMYCIPKPSDVMSHCVDTQRDEQQKPAMNPRFQRNLKHTGGSALGPIGAFRRKVESQPAVESQPVQNLLPSTPSTNRASKVRKVDATVGPSTKEKTSKASAEVDKSKTSSIRMRTGLILPKIDDDTVRMKTAVGLISGDHNALRRSVEQKAIVFWQTLPKR